VADPADACHFEAPQGGLDADGNGCTDTVARLRTLVAALTLKPNIKGGLLAKLGEAQAALDAGKIAVAENKLNDFINLVTAQSGKALTPAQAAMLRNYANNIIALI
jgi:hypothetical protein